MDEAEQALADQAYAAIQAASNYSERSLQAAAFQVGISDLGYCSERTRRMLDGQVPDDTDVLKAFIGTALGDHTEQALVAINPDLIIQTEVTLTLQGEERTYTIPGHPDIIDPVNGILIDVKSAGGLDVVRRTGPSQSQQFQRHNYCLAAYEQGLFPDHELDDLRVANLWVDRTGDEQACHVQMEPFSMDVVRNAAEWLDEVIYNYINQQEAPKEPPREVCAVTCGFFKVCRAYDTDVEGLITDREALAAIEMYVEGLAMARRAESLKKQAKSALKGIEGSTGTHMLRWTHVNESTIPAQTRRGYDKIDIKEVKR